MSEFNTKQVFNIDLTSIADAYEQKAVAAMQATALMVHGDKRATQANTTLVGLSDRLSITPTMTYEDLIFRNPLEREIYVMSSQPAQAQSEAAFYVAHREIEGHLADTIRALKADKPIMSLQHMDSATKRLISLHRSLGAEAFAGFRPFFTGLNGYAGPSGLFSAAIPTIDLLVHNGGNMNNQERQRMRHDLEAGLYPSHQSEVLTDLLINGSKDMLSSTVVNGVIKHLNNFRLAHRGSVKKFVPQALEGHAAGSGGVVDVAGYLARKVVTTQNGGHHD